MAGVVDGEGHVRPSGAIEIEVCDEGFADGIAAALERAEIGFSRSTRHRRRRAVSGEHVVYQLWRFYISAIAARVLGPLIRVEEKRSRIRR